MKKPSKNMKRMQFFIKNKGKTLLSKLGNKINSSNFCITLLKRLVLRSRIKTKMITRKLSFMLNKMERIKKLFKKFLHNPQPPTRERKNDIFEDCFTKNYDHICLNSDKIWEFLNTWSNKVNKFWFCLFKNIQLQWATKF